MAQQTPDTIRYTFSARAPIKPGVVTILPYAAPAAPDVDHNAKLTITRRFYDNSANNTYNEDKPGPPTTGVPQRSALKNSSQPANSRDYPHFIGPGIQSCDLETVLDRSSLPVQPYLHPSATFAPAFQSCHIEATIKAAIGCAGYALPS
ncbi:hypothetical protein LXA43DRAFT_1104119 [Ganoderma leucocontextum]|nr:hypothetical protein LXA43DRAFT_1104119 [Ganoderma leucocontextum]